jgi:predicted ATPase
MAWFGASIDGGLTMLLAFRVANYRSLREQQELSLLVPARARSDSRVTTPLPGSRDHVGVVAGVYGANAAGKSNVISALWSMVVAVVHSHQVWRPEGGAPHEPFLFDADRARMPTTFEVELLLQGERWQYGFALDGRGVESEWLYAFPHARRRVWFERSRERGFYVGPSLSGPIGTLEGLTRPNSLFLSVGAANNHEGLSAVANWFTAMRFCSPMDQVPRVAITIDQMANDAEMAGKIEALLVFADIGIVGAEVRRDRMEPDQRDRLRRAMEIMAPGQKLEEALSWLDTEVALRHRAGEGAVTLPWSSESQGTQAWFGLLGPALMTLTSGNVLLVDEIDASLHPRLLARFVQLFRDRETNPRGSQLIFTSHDASLLGSYYGEAPIYRDELWFTEKNEAGATTLYPLTDFHPRKGESLERGYMQGRYGAVPVFREDLLLHSGS